MTYPVDAPMAGQGFGRLTVVRHEGDVTGCRAKWFCTCECGGTKIARGDHLRSGATRSCGCLKGRKPWLKLEGQVFGRLTVVRREAGEPGQESRWFCTCECGGTVTVRGTGLQDGTTRSCGCISRWEPDRPCGSCGDLTDRLIFGWCLMCYRRWDTNGRPETGPPPRVRVAHDGPDTNLSAGIAAEHLVTADLLLQGHRAFMTDQNCPYDVAVDLGRLLRVQVKATRTPHRPNRPGRAYRFSVTRASYRGYARGEFELLALVALDARLIAYLLPADGVRNVILYPPGTDEGKQFADCSFAKAVAELGLSA